MKLIKNCSLLLLAVLISLSSCDKGNMLKNDALTSIPNDVSMVTAVDLPSLLKKADFEQMKTMEFYQEVIRKATEFNAVLGEAVADPSKSGIDLSKSFYLANEVNPDNPEEVFAGIVFPLKNADAFGNLVKANNSKNVTNSGNFNLLVDGNHSIAWSDKIAVFGSTNSYNDITPVMSKYFSADNTASIAGDKDLQKCFSDRHDIVSWVSSNAVAENEQVKMVLTMANIAPDALKDNFIHSYMDFNDGEIIGHTSTFLNEALAKDLKLFFKDEVKTDFSNYVEAEGLHTLVAAALDLKGIRQVIAERPQTMSFLNFALKQYGITLDDIANTFGGDILISSNNIDGKTAGLVAMDIKDMAGLQKFITLGVEYELLEKVAEDHYRVKSSNFGLYSPISIRSGDNQFIIKNNIVFASNDLNLLNSIKDGKLKESVDKKLMDKVSGNVFGLFMDYQIIGAMAKEDLKLDVTTLEVAAKRKNSDFKLNFKDSKTNSLKQLTEMLNVQYLKAKEKEAAAEKNEI